MKKYYFGKAGNIKGPCLAEELIEKGVDPETLIWTEGEQGWKSANQYPELGNILRKTPPPLPSDNSVYIKKQRLQPNDSNNGSTKTKKVIGAILIVISSLNILSWFIGSNAGNSESGFYYLFVIGIFFSGVYLVNKSTNNIKEKSVLTEIDQPQRNREVVKNRDELNFAGRFMFLSGFTLFAISFIGESNSKAEFIQSPVAYIFAFLIVIGGTFWLYSLFGYKNTM